MVNIKEHLFSWRKEWFYCVITAIIVSAPLIVMVLPVGYASDYEVSKWYTFGGLTTLFIEISLLIQRLESHENTIEKLNQEIEDIKKQLKSTEVQ